MNSKEYKNTVNKDVRYTFIPKCLRLEGLSEYNNMPFNVMFQEFITENDNLLSATAIYEPSFSTFKTEGNICSMMYRNAYGNDSWLKISYDNNENIWHGSKIVDGKCIGKAFGANWKMFFIHFTTLGLSNGEKCKLEKLLIN